MARTLIVSDKQNSFFTANNIKVGTQIPTTGTHSKGDIVVNIGSNTATEAMWICVEAGTPGTWEVVGAGAGGGSGSIVAINDTVTVNNSVTEVSLGNLVGKISSSDKLIVHYNSTHLMEGVDYKVNSEGTRIVKLTEGSWNESGEQALFAFELFKNVESVNGNEIVVDTKLTSIVNNMMVTAPTTEVEIGVEGFDKNSDTLLVFKNGVIMVEGVDYNVNEDSTKIVSINEVWNESSIEEYGITFVVFKEVVIYDGATGGITMGMLGSDVRGTINNLTETTLQHSELIESLDEKVKGIDLSGYATKEDLENVEVDLSPYQEKSSDSLNTNSKDIVGAINEVFQSGNNVKQNLVDALIAKGVSCSTSDSFESLISKIINNLSSTSSTNLDVLVTDTLPNTVVENKLVVISSTSTGIVHIAAEQLAIGSEIQEGDILIQCTVAGIDAYQYVIGDTTKLIMNVANCYEVIGGKYVEVDLNVGKDNEWLLITNNTIVFYDNGTYPHFESKGEKLTLHKKSNSSYGSSTVTENAEDIYISISDKGNVVHVLYGSANKIDLSKYSKLILIAEDVNWTDTGNTGIDLGITNSTTLDSMTKSITVKNGTNTLDITNVNETAYCMLQVKAYNTYAVNIGNGSASIRIKKMWLE